VLPDVGERRRSDPVAVTLTADHSASFGKRLAFTSEESGAVSLTGRLGGGVTIRDSFYLAVGPIFRITEPLRLSERRLDTDGLAHASGHDVTDP
jgi:hypothetical protein